jgi:hypothetical protein
LVTIYTADMAVVTHASLVLVLVLVVPHQRCCHCPPTRLGSESQPSTTTHPKSPRKGDEMVQSGLPQKADLGIL